MKTGSEADWAEGKAPTESYWDHPTGPSGAFPWGEEDCEAADAPGVVLSGGAPPTLEQSAGVERLHVFAQHQGRSKVQRGTWSASLGPGDVALWVDELLPAAWEGPGQQMPMHFPLIGLPEAQREVIRRLPTVLPGAHPGTRILLNVATDLHQAASHIAAPLPPHFLGGFLSMLAGTLACQRSPEDAGLHRLSRFHLERIKNYLRLHLLDADLSAKSVAAALGLSVSHVHRVFAFEGCTVSEWLWRERLAGCAADLSRPGEAHRSVGEIALSWGFNNLSHFSHSFKKRFGLCPKEWRKQAPWRKPLGEADLPG